MLNPARLLRMLIALTLVAGCGGNDTATTEASPTSAELTAATTERWVAAVKAEDPIRSHRCTRRMQCGSTRPTTAALSTVDPGSTTDGTSLATSRKSLPSNRLRLLMR